MKSSLLIKNKIYFFIFFSYFIIGILIVNDYGISVDEEFQRYSGLYWLNYILEFTQFENLKLEVLEKLNNVEGHTLPNPKDYPFYGVTFDLPLALIETVFKIEDSKNYFLLRHYVNFLFFFTSSIFFFFILEDRFKNKNIIIIGTLLFLSSPRIFGDSFYNNKDIILLSFLTINIFFLLRALNNLNLKNLILFSFFSSITCATRVIGFIIPIIFISILLVSKKNKNQYYDNFKIILIYTISLLLCLIIIWPYLWEDPFHKLLYSFKIFSKYPAEFFMFYKGDYIYSKFLPLSYLPTWILITTPIITLVLFIFGYLNLLKRSFNRTINITSNNFLNDFWRSNNEKNDFIIFLCFSIIFFFIVLSNTDLYNGWRHLYFLHIFMIYIACLGLQRITLILKNSKFFFLVIYIFILFNFSEIIKFHPYQGSYFNHLVANNKNNYEVDYWGLAGVKFLKKIILKEKKLDIIKIGVASYLPLERSLKMLDKEISKKIIIVGQDYDKADYIFNNNISEVNKNKNDKYNIPTSFELIDEFAINGFIMYQIYKRI